jgi:hypothetical protein
MTQDILLQGSTALQAHVAKLTKQNGVLTKNVM